MGAKLVKNIYNRHLMMKDLKCGQIAVIIDDNYEGEIVQRHDELGVNIGKSSCHGWTNISNNTLKVRLLEDGELIEIFSNK